MPLYVDRVMETTATTGTGTLALGGAVTGYQAFSASFANNARVFYTIFDGTNWEVGSGTYNAGNLARETVFESSNADALVNFPVGTKNVWCDFPAQFIADRGLAVAIANHMLPQ